MSSRSFNRRDGCPAEHDILSVRLIDRPIRPMIENDWHYETLVLKWLFSYDGERGCKAIAICPSAVALWLSDISVKNRLWRWRWGMLTVDAVPFGHESIKTICEGV